MIDIFQERRRQFMQIPKEILKYKRETFAVELRRSKRNILQYEKRKSFGGSNLEFNDSTLKKCINDIIQSLKENAPKSILNLQLLPEPSVLSFREHLKELLPSLLNYLNSKNLWLIQNVLRFINYLSLSDKYTDIFCSFRVHLELLEVLDFHEDSLYGIIIHILNNMIIDYPLIVDEIIDWGFLNQLHSIVINDKEVITICTHVLCGILNSKSEKINKFWKQKILKICKVCVVNKESIQYCLRILNFLTCNQDVINEIQEFIPLLFDCLKDIQTVNSSLVILQNLTGELQSCQRLLIDEKIYDHLFDVLSTWKCYKPKVFFIISNMFDEDTIEISHFLCHKIKDVVWNSIEDDILEVRIESSYVLRNIIYKATNVQKLYIITLELFRKIENLLNVNDVLDRNYLDFIIFALDLNIIEDNILKIYDESGIHEKVIKLAYAKPFEIRDLAENAIKKYNQLQRNY